MADLPSNQIPAVQSAVSKALASVVGADGERTEARDIFNTASEASGSAREAAIIALAAAATAGNWDSYSLEQGIEKALASRNGADNSVKTFANEIGRACAAPVRKHVPALFSLAKAAWDTEGELDKGAARPLRKAFSRRYHMVVGPMFAEAAGGNVFAEAATLRDFAVERDPALDPARTAKRIAAIREQLKALHADFPLEGLGACDQYLAGITKEELKRARVNATTDASDAAPEIEPETETAPAGDLVDEALGDLISA